MRRLNFTLDDDTVELLEKLSSAYHRGNKSETIRQALRSLAAHSGHDSWVITGYTPVELSAGADCHSCGEHYAEGDVLFRPVFERGESPHGIPSIPAENWLDCRACVERNICEVCGSPVPGGEAARPH